MAQWKNKLYYGDNLRIMREYLENESVDLIYLDPPFNSKATYNVLFREKNGSDSSAQITAFDDTWHWDAAAAETYYDLFAHCPRKLSALMDAFHSFLGQNDMMAYLAMIAARLVEMRRILKPSGSIYLHCDPTASHYLKIVLDAVFGAENFKNEISWKRTTAHSDSKRWGRVHDILFYYTKTEEYTWNVEHIEYTKRYLSRFRNIDEEGRKWADYDLSAKGLSGGGYTYEYKGITSLWRVPPETMKRLDAEGRLHFTNKGGIRLKRYLNDMAGLPIQDVITDISPINSQAQERLGYPTQKPEALLERIIKASSNEGDVVLDPFCGCGTTVTAAEKLNRRWIGIDITHLAITLIKHRMEDSFGQELSPYEIIGDPKDIESAKALAEADKFQFEWWTLSLVDARPAQDKKKGADRGVDGYLYFFDDESGKAKRVVVQVKGGHVSAAQVRDLKGTLEREKAVIGVFITLSEPSAPMKSEAADAGFYEIVHPISGQGMKFPRIQIFTVEELLNGAMVKIPAYALEATIKKAGRVRKKGNQPQQTKLL